MRFGVNYTPRVGWFHSWLDLDLDAIREDFEQIAALDLDHVRIFPLWDLIQPNRGLIRPAGLAAVGDVVDAAAEYGLDVNVDALQGHLSSFDFLPAWPRGTSATCSPIPTPSRGRRPTCARSGPSSPAGPTCWA